MFFHTAPGWYLEKVLIKDTESDAEYSFPCRRYERELIFPNFPSVAVEHIFNSKALTLYPPMDRALSFDARDYWIMHLVGSSDVNL